MTDKTDEPAGWKEAFTKLNEKLGNDVWGARLEGTSTKWTAIRVYVNIKQAVDRVKKETNNLLAGLPLVYTVFSQEQNAILEAKRNEQ